MALEKLVRRVLGRAEGEWSIGERKFCEAEGVVEFLGTMQRRFLVCVCEWASAREMWRMIESEVRSGTRADGNDIVIKGGGLPVDGCMELEQVNLISNVFAYEGYLT